MKVYNPPTGPSKKVFSKSQKKVGAVVQQVIVVSGLLKMKVYYFHLYEK